MPNDWPSKVGDSTRAIVIVVTRACAATWIVPSMIAQTPNDFANFMSSSQRVSFADPVPMASVLRLKLAELLQAAHATSFIRCRAREPAPYWFGISTPLAYALDLTHIAHAASRCRSGHRHRATAAHSPPLHRRRAFPPAPHRPSDWTARTGSAPAYSRTYRQGSPSAPSAAASPRLRSALSRSPCRDVSLRSGCRTAAWDRRDAGGGSCSTAASR